VNDQPLISVIIPTFNREHYLPQAIASVLGQTYDHWELIVVDDGSTDGTRAYLETLPRSRVLVLERQHCGNLALLKNVGVRSARGDWVAFIDSDDVWLPEKLALQVEELRKHAQCDWSYTAYVHMDAHGHGAAWLNRGRPWSPLQGWILEELIVNPALLAVPTVMIRRDCFERMGGFDESLPHCEDVDMWLRLAQTSAVCVVAAPVVKVRMHWEDRGIDTLALLRDINRVYAGVLARNSSSNVRRLCRSMRAEVNIGFVDKLRWSGRYRDARQALRLSLRYGWWHPGWWRAFLKTGLRSLIAVAVATRHPTAATPRDPAQ
jgi:glycosyltransferase involved in cell wall biosynthesis